jgi:hypothetical protein
MGTKQRLLVLENGKKEVFVAENRLFVENKRAHTFKIYKQKVLQNKKLKLPLLKQKTVSV